MYIPAALIGRALNKVFGRKESSGSGCMVLLTAALFLAVFIGGVIYVGVESGKEQDERIKRDPILSPTPPPSEESVKQYAKELDRMTAAAQQKYVDEQAQARDEALKQTFRITEAERKRRGLQECFADVTRESNYCEELRSEDRACWQRKEGGSLPKECTSLWQDIKAATARAVTENGNRAPVPKFQ
jgi:hypothetical protein